MPNPPNIVDNPAKTLKEQFVPFEARASQNISAKPFLWELLKFTVITKLAGMAGGIIGERVFKMPTHKFLFYKLNNGTNIGVVLGATYEGYHHWRKTKGQQLGVSNLSKDTRTAIDTAQLEKEVAKETEIIEGLKKLEELQSRPRASHVDTVAARRETDEQAAGRSA